MKNLMKLALMLFAVVTFTACNNEAPVEATTENVETTTTESVEVAEETQAANEAEQVIPADMTNEPVKDAEVSAEEGVVTEAAPAAAIQAAPAVKEENKMGIKKEVKKEVIKE
ncbi:MAG: hypothetical protein KAG84_08105 [Bacteroidales bacterium]|nr:hypothetical protein [Bacteroidales bacterium]